MSEPKNTKPVENREAVLGSLPDASTWLESVDQFGHLAQRGAGGEGGD